VVDDRGNAYVNTIGFDFPGGESQTAHRDVNIVHSYGFNADFAGFVQVNDLATYGNITYEDWSYVFPASLCGQNRLLWATDTL
jgi:hypothetical protein